MHILLLCVSIFACVFSLNNEFYGELYLIVAQFLELPGHVRPPCLLSLLQFQAVHCLFVKVLEN